MEDREILNLYLARDERAVTESENRYGPTCTRIALNILASGRSAELCVREAYREAMESVPTARPALLGAYLCKLTRAQALDGYLADQAVKRGENPFAAVLDELGTCIPAAASAPSESPTSEADVARAGDCVTLFLRKLRGEDRDIFLCRYFYAESAGEIARRMGLSESRVNLRLRRTRAGLRKFLEREAQSLQCLAPEALARSLNRVDDGLILAAHGKAKRARRLIPWVAAVCVAAVAAVSFPWLRTVINTDLILRGPDWNKEQEGVGEVELPDKPDAESILAIGTPASVGNCTVTLIEVTETTATLTIVKTDGEPLYAAVYDRMGDALACTDPDYKVDGVTIRPNRIKVYTNSASEPAFELPAAAGTYTVVVDFTSIRNGAYPMEDYLGIMAYVGKDAPPATAYFSLALPEPETEPETEGDTGSETDGETDGEDVSS